jgi:hypothetical protein
MAVPVKERDYLDQDPEIRGQKYVCLSFISPEDVIRNKESYFLSRYISDFSKDLGLLFTNIREKFKDDQVVVDMIDNVKERYDYVFDDGALQKEFEFFKNKNAGDLEKEYLEKNDFQTSIRGIKVRGVYESIMEARNRAGAIKRFDPKFDVYVAEVGCWCPWGPSGEQIQEQEFSETQLNTLMKKYKENLEVKDEYYRLRMEDKVKKVNDQRNQVVSTPIVEEGEEDDEEADAANEVIEAVTSDQPDAWMARKQEETP